LDDIDTNLLVLFHTCGVRASTSGHQSTAPPRHLLTVDVGDYSVVSEDLPRRTPSECYSGWLRNPAPVDRWLIPLFIGFQQVSTILLVVQDFVHPQHGNVPRMFVETHILARKIQDLIVAGLMLHARSYEKWESRCFPNDCGCMWMLSDSYPKIEMYHAF